MNISSLFSPRAAKVSALSSEVIELLPFPSGIGVPAVEGRYLCDDFSWKDLRLELFICSELAIDALATISANFKNDIQVKHLLAHADDKYRCARLSGYGEATYTFVPTALLLGVVLLQLHKYDVPRKMRLAQQVTSSLSRALEQYPKVGKERILEEKESAVPTSRFAELGMTQEEFEFCQQAKYEDAYRTMRGLIPPNIAKTDMKTMLKEGVPRDIAERVWQKKVLWLICMHADDLPKIHIADLRSKYDFHGLDVVEMRAIWFILPNWEGSSQKAEWRRFFKTKLDDMVAREIEGIIEPDESRDSAYLGYEDLPPVYDPYKHLARQFGVFMSVKSINPGDRREKVFKALTPQEAASAGIGTGKLYRRRSMSMRSPGGSEDDDEDDDVLSLTPPRQTLVTNRETNRSFSLDWDELYKSNKSIKVFSPIPEVTVDDIDDDDLNDENDDAVRLARNRSRSRSPLTGNIADDTSEDDIGDKLYTEEELLNGFIAGAKGSCEKKNTLSPTSSLASSSFYDKAASIARSITTAERTNAEIHAHAELVKKKIKPYKPIKGPLAETAVPFSALKQMTSKRLVFRPPRPELRKFDSLGGALSDSFYSPMDSASGSGSPTTGGRISSWSDGYPTTPPPQMFMAADEKLVNGSRFSTSKKEKSSKSVLFKGTEDEARNLNTLSNDNDSDGGQHESKSDTSPNSRAKSFKTLDDFGRSPKSPGRRKAKMGFVPDWNDTGNGNSNGVGSGNSSGANSVTASGGGRYKSGVENNTEFVKRSEMAAACAREDYQLAGKGLSAAGGSLTGLERAQQRFKSFSHSHDINDYHSEVDTGAGMAARGQALGRRAHSTTAAGMPPKAPSSIISDPLGTIKYMFGGGGSGGSQSIATHELERNDEYADESNPERAFYESDQDSDNSADLRSDIGGHYRAASTVSISSTSSMSLRASSTLPPWTLWGMFGRGDGALSPEEEQAEREIEKEIDDFIVPEELSPARLKRAAKSATLNQKSVKFLEGDIEVDEDDDPDALFGVSDDEGSENGGDDDVGDGEDDGFKDSPTSAAEDRNRSMDGGLNRTNSIGERTPMSSAGTDNSVWQSVRSGGDEDEDGEGEDEGAKVRVEVPFSYDDQYGGDDNYDYLEDEDDYDYGDDEDEDEDEDDEDNEDSDDSILRNVCTKKPFSPDEPPAAAAAAAGAAPGASIASLRIKVPSDRNRRATGRKSSWEREEERDGDGDGGYAEGATEGYEDEDRDRDEDRAGDGDRERYSPHDRMIPEGRPSVSPVNLDNALVTSRDHRRSRNKSNSRSSGQRRRRQTGGIPSRRRDNDDDDDNSDSYGKDRAIKELTLEELYSESSDSGQSSGINISRQASRDFNRDSNKENAIEVRNSALALAAGAKLLHTHSSKDSDQFSHASSAAEEDIETLAPRERLTEEDIERAIIYGEARQARELITSGAMVITSEEATALLLKCCNTDPEEIKEPLETIVLLVDLLGADVNARDADGMTPLHSLFSQPLLGRFILSRGGDVLAKNADGDSVLDLCAEYGYDWILPAFEARGEEEKLLENPSRAKDYAISLITKWGMGGKVAEMLADDLVVITADEALEMLDTLQGRFDELKQPIETFELLESLALQ